MAEGMPIDLSSLPPSCEHCILAKQTKNPVPKVREGPKSDRKLGVVYIDLTGPMAVRSRNGNYYSMELVDEYTSMIWAITLPSKDVAFQRLQEWERERKVETNGLEVGIYRTDNGKLKSNEMERWLKSKGTRQHPPILGMNLYLPLPTLPPYSN